MKKRLLAVVMAVVMAIALCAPALGEAGDNSLDALKARGKLILGMDDKFPPMGFRNEAGELIGFDVDLARAVCERLGVELELQTIEWSSKELELSSGNIDCIWNGMSRTAEREESMTLSLDYMNNQMVFLCNNAAFASRDDLAGKVVAVQSGSFADDLINDASFGDLKATLGEVRGYPDYIMAIMDMQNGNVDAVLIDLVVANYRIAGFADDTLFTMDPLMDDLFCIGFRKGEVQLRDAIDETMVSMQADGSLGRIAEVWFGENISIIPAA